MTEPTPEEIAAAEQLHAQAMETLDGLTLARMRGQPSDIGDAHRLWIAFDKEKAAAEIVAPFTGFEPSRSILMRSAATLAMRCGDRTAAEDMVTRALSGNPPADIAQELRDVLK